MKAKFLFFFFLFLSTVWGFNAFALCVVNQGTTLHSGPGFQYPKTSWDLSTHTPLKKLDVWNDWYKVSDVDGDVHWVHSGATADGYSCLIVKIDKAILRGGPGKRYHEAESVLKYHVFRLSNKKEKWLQVNYEDEWFWLLDSSVWIQ